MRWGGCAGIPIPLHTLLRLRAIVGGGGGGRRVSGAHVCAQHCRMCVAS